MRLVFDIETDSKDGNATTKVHCLVVKNRDTGERQSFADQPGHRPISEGLGLMSGATEISGHNIIGYDLPQLLKLRQWFVPGGCKVRDTLLLVRMVDCDINDRDYKACQTRVGYGSSFPQALLGKQGLEAWGHRLGKLKGDFHKNANWSEWSEEMQSYCCEDVEVNDELLKYIDSMGGVTELAEYIETSFQWAANAMVANGFTFDIDAATKLYSTLCGRREELRVQLEAAFEPNRQTMKKPAWYSPDGGVSKYATKGEAVRHGGKRAVITIGPPKVKITPFNPGSRDQVADRLLARGWRPSQHTDGGKPQIDDDVLQLMPFPEAKLLAEYFMVGKRIGQIGEGKNAWLKLATKYPGHWKMHGDIITLGTPTARCAHLRPNIAQVPKCTKPYGKECRGLFGPRPGYVLVGVDASGLELRALGHYLHRYDGGAYAKTVVEGDIHTENQKAFGLPPGPEVRNERAKPGIYALIYGAGDGTLGVTLYPNLFGKKEAAEAAGRRARMLFRKSTKGFGQLCDVVKARCSRQTILFPLSRQRAMYLTAVDGRRLLIRSKHSAMNALFQSLGSIAVKLATVIAGQKIIQRGLRAGLVAHIHDEMQYESHPDDATAVGKLVVESIEEAGRTLKLNVPLTGEYKIGRTWAETH